MALWHRAVSYVFVFLLSISLVAAVGIDNPYIPIVKPEATSGGSASNNTNSSDYWNTDDHGPLGAVGEIEHTWLSGLAWSVAGHIMDAILDMNGFDITEVGKIYFGAGLTGITSDSNNTQWVEYT